MAEQPTGIDPAAGETRTQEQRIAAAARAAPRMPCSRSAS